MNLGDLQGTLRMAVRHYSGLAGKGLPEPEGALPAPEGLAGFCGSLDVVGLKAGYAKGLYAEARRGPQKWWAPQERMVLFFENFRIGSRLKAKLESGRYKVSFDEDFEAVARRCVVHSAGAKGRGAFRADLAALFASAHRAGIAHSVEVRNRAGELAGGAIGLSVGKVFFTEAQFSDEPDAARIALAALNLNLKRWGYVANDGKRLTGALCRQGFTPVSRGAFGRLLEKACAGPAPVGLWSLNEAGRAPRGFGAPEFAGAA